MGNDEVIPTAEHVEHVAIGDVPAVVHADRTVDGGDVDVLVGVPSEEVVHGNPDKANFAFRYRVAVLVADVDDFAGVDAATECGVRGEFFGPCDGDRAGF